MTLSRCGEGARSITIFNGATLLSKAHSEKDPLWSKTFSFKGHFETFFYVLRINRYNKAIVLPSTKHKHLIISTILIICLSQVFCQTGNTSIYILMNDRKELKLAPQIDTLVNNEEYTYKLTIDPHYQFAELFCERGLAVKIDNTLRVTPNSAKQSGIDTMTLRIILFSPGGRILFYKHLYVKVSPKDYQKAIRKQPEEVTMDNMVLERNFSYNKSNFHPNSAFSFVSHDTISPTNKKVVSVTISLINQSVSKSFYIKGDQMTTDVYSEIKKQHQPVQAYIRLEVKIGRKTKTIWTRFTMNGGERITDSAHKRQLASLNP